MANVDKKRVFLMVPIEKGNDNIIERAVANCKKDYLKARGVKEEDVYFYDYFHDLKQAKDQTDAADEILKNHTKNPGLDDLGWMVSMLGMVDEVILGYNWTLSRSCKVIAKTAETYMIPQIRIMHGNKKPEIEDKPETVEYRKRHHIETVWKG